jgi:DNA repair protein RecO (recombination protein O)
MVDFFELLEKHAADNDNNARLFYFIMVTKHILSYVGYGFSLDKCVATGDCDIETLKYLSPRTASAISEQAAKPYLDVVLKLPRFFTTEDISDVGCGDLLCGFNIITYFFIKIIREHLHINDTPSYWQKVQDFFTQSN